MAKNQATATLFIGFGKSAGSGGGAPLCREGGVKALCRRFTLVLLGFDAKRILKSGPS